MGAWSVLHSRKARYRTVVRSGAIAEIKHDLIDIAPAPAFGRIVTFDDRMTGRVKVPRGVAMRRVVATADMAASSAEAQMHPWRANLQTLLAAKRTWRHIANCRLVKALVGHRGPPVYDTKIGLTPVVAR